MTNKETAFTALALLEIIDTLNQISQDVWDNAAQTLGRVYQSRDVVANLYSQYDLNLSVHHVLDVVDDFNAKSRDLFARVSLEQGLTREVLIERYHQDDEAILALIQPAVMQQAQEGVTLLLAISE